MYKIRHLVENAFLMLKHWRRDCRKIRKTHFFFCCRCSNSLYCYQGKCFSLNYCRHYLKSIKKFFPRLVSYNRFVELMPNAALPIIFFVYFRKGMCRGINFVDSTTLDVCDCHRIQQHKVFKGIAQRGKSSTGFLWI